MKEIYDLIIIGLGPAGLTASIYASRYNLSHLVIGKNLGGEMALASSVENFPGFPAISGLELGQKMAEQAKTLGAEIIYGEIVKVKMSNAAPPAEPLATHGKCQMTNHPPAGGQNQNGKSGGIIFEIYTLSKKKYLARTLVVASGTERRKLGVPGEMEFLGRGVSYCTTCDAVFFRGKTVAVIGGGDSAAQGAVHLAGFADKVYIIYRGQNLRAEPMWAKAVTKNPKIEVIYRTNILEIAGDGGEESSKLKTHRIVQAVELDSPYHGSSLLAVDGVFIEIGGVPMTVIAKDLGVELTEKGFIKVNEDMSTITPGVFAAGDVTGGMSGLQQIITACGQGALASASVFKFLRGQPAPRILGTKK